MGIEGLSAKFVPDFQTYPRRCFYLKSHLKSIVTCDNLEGWWDGLGGGREVQGEGTYIYLWLIHVDTWQKPTRYCKAITLQLKIN